MPSALSAVRTRLLPAILTATGVTLIAAGLLSYADPTTAGAHVAGSPVAETLRPTPSDGPTGSASGTPDPTGSASAGPDETGSPSASPGERALATRVVIPALEIDLPIVEGPPGYPSCNVAMYIRELAQPGEGRATYLYAHARDGMFGPIYETVIRRDQPGKLKGMIVQVYTSDDRLYLYEVKEVRLHQTDLGEALDATTEQLWLQTSEGPKGTVGKTQVIATLLSVGDADPADAHPRARPVRCS
jgi:hypothetical protein